MKESPPPKYCVEKWCRSILKIHIHSSVHLYCTHKWGVLSRQLQAQDRILHVSHMVMCRLHQRWIRIVNLPMQYITDEKNMVMLQIHWYIMNIWGVIHYWFVLSYMVHNTWRQMNPVWWRLKSFFPPIGSQGCTYTHKYINIIQHTHTQTGHL